MIEISANTLQEAYIEAAKALNASVVDLEIEIVQNPSSGFLGLFSKPAVIRASIKGAQKPIIEEAKIQNEPLKTATHVVTQSATPQVKAKNDSLIEVEIKEGLHRLLQASCFDVVLISLLVDSAHESVYIKLDGRDAALLIGKEGYRYKALSYLLHNWIKIKYDLTISLEIAEFLKNQEASIAHYLIGIKEKVDQTGRAQTRPLDGILVKIALSQLRQAYPQKYVAIRTLKDGRKVIVVNEFKKGEA